MNISIIHINKSLLLSALLFLVVGCGANAPDKSVVEDLIKNSIEKRGVALKDFKIIEIGVVQGEGTQQYWPVKVSFSGRWKAGRQKNIKKETIYNISKDGFDKWSAKPTEIY